MQSCSSLTLYILYVLYLYGVLRTYCVLCACTVREALWSGIREVRVRDRLEYGVGGRVSLHRCGVLLCEGLRTLYCERATNSIHSTNAIILRAYHELHTAPTYSAHIYSQETHSPRPAVAITYAPLSSSSFRVHPII